MQGDPEEEGEEGEGAAKGGRQLRTGACAACCSDRSRCLQAHHAPCTFAKAAVATRQGRGCSAAHPTPHAHITFSPACAAPGEEDEGDAEDTAAAAGPSGGERASASKRKRDDKAGMDVDAAAGGQGLEGLVYCSCRGSLV